MVHVVRLYSGDDGESHFEDLEIPIEGGLSLAFPVATLDFREAPGEHEPGWHNASRRQFVITTNGALEIEIGSGETRRLGPGDAMLAEDLTGRGHVSRTVASPRRSIVVPLAADADLEALLDRLRGGGGSYA